MASLSRTLRAGRPLHILMAIGVGVSSGIYLFKQPLQKQFEAERRRAEASAAKRDTREQ